MPFLICTITIVLEHKHFPNSFFPDEVLDKQYIHCCVPTLGDVLILCWISLVHPRVAVTSPSTGSLILGPPDPVRLRCLSFCKAKEVAGDRSRQRHLIYCRNA